jgi:hypothetical protein
MFPQFLIFIKERKEAVHTTGWLRDSPSTPGLKDSIFPGNHCRYTSSLISRLRLSLQLSRLFLKKGQNVYDVAFLSLFSASWTLSLDEEQKVRNNAVEEENPTRAAHTLVEPGTGWSV